MNTLTVRQYRSMFNQALNIANWKIGGKNLELESPDDPLTRLTVKERYESLLNGRKNISC